MGARVNSLPKVHVADTGLGGWLLGIRERGIGWREPTVQQQFGHRLYALPIDRLWS